LSPRSNQEFELGYTSQPAERISARLMEIPICHAYGKKKFGASQKGKPGNTVKVITDNILLYACASALSLLSRQPKRTSKAAEGDQKSGSGVPV
jgi:hypothetical protein